jgi:hypothetical protein
MDIRKLWLLIGFAVLALTACTSNPTETIPETSLAASKEPMEMPSISPEGGFEPTATHTALVPTATPAPLPYPKYLLSATLDYDNHFLAAEETITYYNHYDTPLSNLVLLVEPNRIPGGFELKDLRWTYDQAITDYTFDGAELTIPLEKPLNPGDHLGINISYNLTIPQQNAPYGYSERQTNLSDWYPYVPPYVPGAGWLVREPSFPGEHLAYDTSDFEVDIQFTNPTSADGLPLTIAASALDKGSNDQHSYRLEAARNFAWSVSDQYQVLTTTVGDIQVLGYSFPYHAGSDEPALRTTADALALYSDLFGPYPHESLSVVEADFLNGMEYEGLNFLSHAFYDYFTGTPENNLVIIAAHEVAHQWFYGQVGNDQALEPWLDEALCTYSESLFYKHYYPDLEQWWWDNRVRFHEPTGWVDSTIYDTNDFNVYKDAVYLRGAMFVEDLRVLIGDETFDAFLLDYLKQYTHEQATASGFFALLENHTDADLSGLLSEYFANR